jgi:hypothetical protein
MRMLKLHGLAPVESLSSLRRCEKNAEAEFMALSIPRRFASQSEAVGEFREGGLKF